MKKSKSVFATVLIAVMLAAITVGMYLLKYRAYLIIVGALGLYGYFCASCHFCRWLGKEPPLLPAHTMDDVKPYIPAARARTFVVEDFPEEPQQVESTHEIMGYEK